MTFITCCWIHLTIYLALQLGMLYFFCGNIATDFSKFTLGLARQMNGRHYNASSRDTQVPIFF